MELKIVGKKIITEPIKENFVQGEANVDTYSIVIPRIYGDIDLSLFSFKMRAKSSKDTIAEEVLKTVVNSDSITLFWKVTGEFTAVDGALSLELVGVNSNCDEIIKFTSSDIFVKQNLIGSYNPPASLIEQALAQMQIAVERAISEADRASTYVGKSAYEVWISDGNSGTVQDFLNSIKGENGEKGEVGESGKAVVINDTTTTSAILNLADNYEYQFLTLTSLDVTFPSDIYSSFITFSSGQIATAINFPIGTKFIGVDVTDGKLTVMANKRYTMGIYFDGLYNIVAVGGY